MGFIESVASGLIVIFLAYLASKAWERYWVGGKRQIKGEVSEQKRINGAVSKTGSWRSNDYGQIRAISKVLIVDDEHESLPLKEQLKKAGFSQVQSCRNVPDTETLKKFDFVVIDNKGVGDAFGASDGYESIRRMLREVPWMPILLFTSYVDDVKGAKTKFLNANKIKKMSKTSDFVDVEDHVVDEIDRTTSRDYFIENLKSLGLDSIDDQFDDLLSSHDEMDFSKIDAKNRMIASLFLERAKNVYFRGEP